MGGVQSDGPDMGYGQNGRPHGYGIIRYEGAPEERPDEAGKTNGVIGTDLHPIINVEAPILESKFKRIEEITDRAPSLDEVTKVFDFHVHPGIAKYNYEEKKWEPTISENTMGQPSTGKYYIGGKNAEHVYLKGRDPAIFQTVLDGMTESTDPNPSHFYVNIGDVVQIQWTDYVQDAVGPGNGWCIKHDYHLHGDGFYVVHFSNTDFTVPTSEDEYNLNYEEVYKRDIVSTWFNFNKYGDEPWFMSSEHGSPPLRKFACSLYILRWRVRFPGVWPFIATMQITHPMDKELYSLPTKYLNHQ